MELTMSTLRIVVVDDQGREHRIDLSTKASCKLKEQICQGSDPCHDVSLIVGGHANAHPRDNESLQELTEALRDAFD